MPIPRLEPRWFGRIYHFWLKCTALQFLSKRGDGLQPHSSPPQPFLTSQFLGPFFLMLNWSLLIQNLGMNYPRKPNKKKTKKEKKVRTSPTRKLHLVNIIPIPTLTSVSRSWMNRLSRRQWYIAITSLKRSKGSWIVLLKKRVHKKWMPSCSQLGFVDSLCVVAVPIE